MNSRNKFFAATMALLTATPAAFATNGYFSHGYGIKTKALAGAGIALPQDSLAIATNPAGLTEIGTRFDVGVLTATALDPTPILAAMTLKVFLFPKLATATRLMIRCRPASPCTATAA